MSVHDKDMEKKLIGCVEDVITKVNSGIDETEAMIKVASDQKLTPPQIHRIVESYNKTKSVVFLKNAEASIRASNISPINSSDIIQGVYIEDEGTMEKAASALPNDDFSNLGLPIISLFEKEADNSYSDRDRLIAEQGIEKYASAFNELHEKLDIALKASKFDMEENIEKIAGLLQPIEDNQLYKIARTVTNAYPKTGSKILKLLSFHSGKDLPQLNKTASMAIFPLEEPYISINKLYDTTRGLLHNENRLKSFEKEAYINPKAIVDDLAAEWISYKYPKDGATFKPSNVLTPDVQNKFEKMDTIRSLFEMIVDNDEFDKYDFPEIVKVFNHLTTSAKNITDRPGVLKDYALTLLESGENLDSHQMQSLIQTGELIEKTKEKIHKIKEFKEDAQSKTTRGIGLPQELFKDPTLFQNAIGSVESSIDSAINATKSTYKGMKALEGDERARVADERARVADERASEGNIRAREGDRRMRRQEAIADNQRNLSTMDRLVKNLETRGETQAADIELANQGTQLRNAL